MPRSKKKTPKRFNILVVRPKGGAASFTVSPFLLLFLLLFSIMFMVFSIVIMNKYFYLYFEHRDLEKNHLAANEELLRLQNLYSYQAMVSRDYASYVRGEEANPLGGGQEFIPLGSLPLGGKVEALDLLDAWAAFFPVPVASEDQALDIDRFEVENNEFKIELLNEADGRVGQGRLLLLFTVLYPGYYQLTLLPYPNFNPQDREPVFNSGLSYDVSSAEPVEGRLRLPANARVVEMMVVARSESGEIMLKKKLAPTDQ